MFFLGKETKPAGDLTVSSMSHRGTDETATAATASTTPTVTGTLAQTFTSFDFPNS